MVAKCTCASTCPARAAFKNHAAASAKPWASVHGPKQLPAPRSNATPRLWAAWGSPNSAANFHSFSTSASLRRSTVLSRAQSSCATRLLPLPLPWLLVEHDVRAAKAVASSW
jgi:hypothetical protein